jgi:hypothetical protein
MLANVETPPHCVLGRSSALLDCQAGKTRKVERTIHASDQKVDWRSLASAVRERLKCGRDRIADGPVPSAVKWWPEPLSVQLELLSDVGVSEGPEELIEEWSEEVLAIQNLLDGVVPNEDPSPGQSGAAYRLERTTALRARAIAVWDQIGVPIRWREGLVHHIHSPNDVLGAPAIRVLPPEAYTEALTERLAAEVAVTDPLRRMVAAQAADAGVLRRRVAAWRAATTVIGVVALVMYLASGSF